MANIMFIVGLLVVALTSYAKCAFTENCMKCICEAEGCQSEVGKCRMDVFSISCGPYQIKLPYYKDCSRTYRNTVSEWQTCTKQMSCSETCVKSYMRRYEASCKSRFGREPTCIQYAKMHNMGTGAACYTYKTNEDYTRKMKDCCKLKGGCD